MSPDHDRLGHYLRLLVVYATRAADCVESTRQDEFLWHARRSTEAVLLAVLASRGTSEPTAADCGLDKLRNLVGELPQTPHDVRADLEVVRTNVNLGVHTPLIAQSAARSGDMGQVSAKVRKHFPDLLQWAADQPHLREHLQDPTFGQLIERIRSGSGPSEVGRLMAQLESARTSLRGSRAQGTVSGALGASLACYALWAFVLEPQGGGARPANMQRDAGVLASRELDASIAAIEPTEFAPASPDAPTPLPEGEHAPSSRASASPPAIHCPTGTMRVLADELQGVPVPHPRPDWPRRLHPATLSTPSFCLDSEAVKVEEYSACVAEGVCAGRPNSTRAAAFARAISRDDASTFCDWRASRLRTTYGRLPSIAEFEIAVHQPDQRRRFGTEQNYYEWVSDNANASPWGDVGQRSMQSMTRRNMDASNNSDRLPFWSWNRHDPQSDASIGFRCSNSGISQDDGTEPEH